MPWFFYIPLDRILNPSKNSDIMQIAKTGIRETFGLKPLVPALKQCWRALAGDQHVPPSQWGLSSVRIFKPTISFPAWLGRRRADRLVPIYNLFNRIPAPRTEGYSVKVTYCRDFRGQQLTYDGHVGTDFAVPVGTEVVAAAPGVVRGVRNDMERGGLKIVIDHGRGVLTTSNHLARAMVRVGQRVGRGETIGLSGMSGVDGVLFFPWLAPHVHFNVVLNGVPVDPFAREGETSLWRVPNDPKPHRGGEDVEFVSTRWDQDAILATLEDCKDAQVRARLEAIEDVDDRAVAVLIERFYWPHCFGRMPRLYAETFEAGPLLDLPFRAEDFAGIVFPDEAVG